MEDIKTQTTDAGTKDQADNKVAFTPEQQALVDNIVKNAMGRAGKEAKELAEAASKRAAELESQLNDVMSKMTKTDTKTNHEQLSDVEALRAQIQEMQAANKTLQQQFESVRRQKEDTEKALDSTKKNGLEIQKRVMVKDAATKFGFIDNDEVLALTDRYFKFDGNNIEVVNDQGTVRMNTMYNPMTPEEFFNEFAQKKPHLVKSTHKTGTGATASSVGSELQGAFTVEKVFGAKSDAKIAMQLKQKNPNEYARLKTIAQNEGLI